MSDKEAAKELGITDAELGERLALATTIGRAMPKVTYRDREGRTSWKVPEFAELLHEDGWRRSVDVRAAIAFEIRAELVCCDIYERLAPKRAEISAGRPGWGEAHSELIDAIGEHDLCYWGEAAARIAESHELRNLQ